MTNLIRAEFRKLLSTQVWFWMLMLSVAITALLVIVNFLNRSDIDSSNIKDIFTTGLTSYIAAFVLGVLSVTTEFRYQTITPTLLTTPSRWTVMTAKVLAYVVVGATMALACVLTTLVIAVPWLASRHVDYSFTGDGAAQRTVEVATIVALFALIGLGFGAAVRNQIVAVTVGIVFLLLIENLLPAIPGVRHVYPFLLGGAVQAIITPHDNVSGDVYALGIPGGYAVLIAWAAGLAAIGAFYTLNRDIT